RGACRASGARSRRTHAIRFRCRVGRERELQRRRHPRSGFLRPGARILARAPRPFAGAGLRRDQAEADWAGRGAGRFHDRRAQGPRRAATGAAVRNRIARADRVALAWRGSGRLSLELNTPVGGRRVAPRFGHRRRVARRDPGAAEPLAHLRRQTAVRVDRREFRVAPAASAVRHETLFGCDDVARPQRWILARVGRYQAVWILAVAGAVRDGPLAICERTRQVLVARTVAGAGIVDGAAGEDLGARRRAERAADLRGVGSARALDREVAAVA